MLRSDARIRAEKAERCQGSGKAIDKWNASGWVTIAQARLDQAREDDMLTFEVALWRTGRTRFHSTIVVRSDDVEIARCLCRREPVAQPIDR